MKKLIVTIVIGLSLLSSQGFAGSKHENVGGFKPYHALLGATGLAAAGFGAYYYANIWQPSQRIITPDTNSKLDNLKRRMNKAFREDQNRDDKHNTEKAAQPLITEAQLDHFTQEVCDFGFAKPDEQELLKALKKINGTNRRETVQDLNKIIEQILDNNKKNSEQQKKQAQDLAKKEKSFWHSAKCFALSSAVLWSMLYFTSKK
jgi:hypothetical protein